MNKLIPFSLFCSLFFFAMWTSKLIQPIYFENSHQLINYGLNNSAMALAGYFTFLIGHAFDRYGFRTGLITGCLAYAFGLYLRIYPSSATLNIAGGLIAGLGASCAIVGTRFWMLHISTANNQSRMMGIRNSTTALGAAIGSAVAGIAAGKHFEIPLPTILISASVVMILLSGWVYSTAPKEKSSPLISESKKGLWGFFLENKNLSLWALGIGCMDGFYVSFISPYLPVILKSKGFDMTAVGLSTGVLALVRFVVDPMVGRWLESRKEHSFLICICAEFGLLAATSVFLSPINHTGFILFLILRSALLGISVIAEEITWLKIFPKENIGLCFGLIQSGFFLGDFFGGLINGRLYALKGVEGCAMVAMVVMTVNIFLFSKFINKNKASRNPEILSA
jgi:MFS family permease